MIPLRPQKYSKYRHSATKAYKYSNTRSGKSPKVRNSLKQLQSKATNHTDPRQILEKSFIYPTKHPLQYPNVKLAYTEKIYSTYNSNNIWTRFFELPSSQENYNNSKHLTYRSIYQPDTTNSISSTVVAFVEYIKQLHVVDFQETPDKIDNITI